MLQDSTNLQIYSKFNQGISNTVCAFLNTNGGRIICYNNGKYFIDEEKVEKYKSKLESILQNNISDYPNNRIKYNIINIENNYFIDILISKSTIIHYVLVKGKKISYIRSGKENKKLSYELNFDIRPATNIFENYYKIGNFATGNYFYKYMSLENALQCLRGGNIWFVETSKWKDKYEEYFYRAKILGKDCSENNPVIYATCVTNKKESESAWKIYAYNTQGLASRCVEFILNRKKMREILSNCYYRINDSEPYNKLLKKEYNIYEGVVVYKDEQIIFNLSKPEIKINKTDVPNEWFHAYFDNFSFEKYLNLLLLKRTAFEHEHETRIFITKKSFDSRDKKDEGHIDLKIPWEYIIEGVRYDANCSVFESKLLEEEIKKALGLKTTDSFPTGFVFEKYDVYKGPKPAIINAP